MWLERGGDKRAAGPDDLTALLAAGLMVESASSGSGRASSQPSATTPNPPVAAPVEATAQIDLSYRDLYDSLDALSKEQLGLFKGYKFALEIEKASGVEELREVAQRPVVEVQKVKGDSAAQMVRRALGLR
jgi:hypothetical protein